MNTTVLVRTGNCYGVRKEILSFCCTKFQKYDVDSQESCQKRGEIKKLKKSSLIAVQCKGIAACVYSLIIVLYKPGQQ